MIIESLGYPTFDEKVATLNRLENTVTLNGTIATEGTNLSDQLGGDITIRGVVLTLGPSFGVTKETDAVLGLFAGILQDGFTAPQLFIDNAPGSFSAVFNVQWTSTVPEPSTLSLIGIGTIGLAICHRRRRAS